MKEEMGLKQNSSPSFRWMALMALLVAFSTSCSKSKVDTKLEFSFTNKAPFLIPYSTASCTSIVTAVAAGDTPAADISERYFTISNPVIKWYDTQRTIQIVAITVKIDSPALGISQYACGIFDVEIGAVFGSGITPWSRTLAAAVNANTPSVTTLNSSCPARLVCGSVTPAIDIDGKATATLKILGVATESSGDEIPVSYETTFSVQNLKL